MAYSDEIAKTVASPRVVVTLYDGATTYYYGLNPMFLSDGTQVLPNVINIGPVEYAAQYKDLFIPTNEITLADVDGTIEGLSIKKDWTISVYLGFVDLAWASWEKLATYRLSEYPKYQNGVVSLKCIVAEDLGVVTLPEIEREDIDNGRPDLIGETFPLLFGDHADEPQGEIELTRYQENSARDWVISVERQQTAAPSIAIDSLWCDPGIGELFEIPSSMYTFNGTTHIPITRAGERPSTWYLKAIQLTDDDLIDYLNERPQQVKMYANLLKDGVGSSFTPYKIALDVLANYSHDGSGSGLTDTNQYQSSSVIQTAMLRAGIYSKYKVEKSANTLEILRECTAETGLKLWFDGNATLQFQYDSNEGLTASDVIGGHSGASEWDDYLHFVSNEQIHKDPINRITVVSNGVNNTLDDSDAQTDAEVISEGYNNGSMSKSGSYAAAWHFLQLNRDIEACRGMVTNSPLPMAEVRPGDKIKITERWSGDSDTLYIVQRVMIDLMANTVMVTADLWQPKTATNPYVLIDESAQVTGPTGSETLTLTSGSAQAIASSSTGATWQAGDIIEIRHGDPTATTGHFSSKILSVIGVIITMADNSDITAINIPRANWETKKSYATATAGDKATSGFLCDESDGFFVDDSSAGKVLV